MLEMRITGCDPTGAVVKRHSPLAEELPDVARRMEDSQNEKWIGIAEVDDEVWVHEVEEKRLLRQITSAMSEAGKISQLVERPKQSVGGFICCFFAEVLNSILDDRQDII
jgi:hypothetical protein